MESADVSLSMFEPDPAYGSGTYRRRIRLRRLSDHAVGATLDDDYHALWCRIDHQGGVVKAVDGGFRRAPTTVCGTAAGPLGELVGMALASDYPTLVGGGRLRRNCTHMFDLAMLAMAQAVRTASDRLYDVAVTDLREGRQTAEVACDGAAVHRWEVVGGQIAAPARLTGQPMVAGFARWAAEAFAGDGLEAALVLHRGYFVSQARARLTMRRYRLAERPGNDGVCHAYSGLNRQVGYSIPESQRDFTAGVVEAGYPEDGV